MLVALLTLAFIGAGFVFMGRAFRGGVARRTQARSYARYVEPPAVPPHSWQGGDATIVPSDAIAAVYRGADHSNASVDAVETTTIDGARVTAFDLHVPSGDHSLRFMCARVDTPLVSCPHLSVRATKLTGGYIAAAEGASSIKLESDDFNHAFRVDTPDRSFAYELLDAQMIELLLATPSLCVLDVSGGAIALAFASNHVGTATYVTVSPSEVVHMMRNKSEASALFAEYEADRWDPEQRLGFVCSLLERLPEVVRSKYNAA